MKLNCKSVLLLAAVIVSLLAGSPADSLSPELKAKVDAKAKELQSWSTDPQIVAAVKAYNAAPPRASQAMTNEKWKSLSILDPFVRSFNKNALGEHLKAIKDPIIVEAFVSGADGHKVAFLSKPTNWSHKGKPKHEVPMTGKTWIGPTEVDESTGQLQVQVGLPVLDAGTPIGSIVIGLKVAALN